MNIKSFSFWLTTGIILFIIPYFYINIFAYNKIFTINTVEKDIISMNPENKVGIVFGAAAWNSGPSDVFKDRLVIAQKLYNTGRIQKILVSGDNSQQNYNEPETGRQFLLSQNIPEEDIILDYAGFRTYDTCFRAKHIFKVNKAILITQRFHLPRAIFYCSSMDIEVQGVSASLQVYTGAIKNIIRESLAQQVAFYEAYVFPHNPKFLGEVIPIQIK